MSRSFDVGIERLLPHRGAMRWVDRLLHSDPDSVAVETVLRADHPLADAQGVPAFAGIELMAQSIAVWAGCRALNRGEAIRPGFLLGSRRYTCERSHFDFDIPYRIEARCELFGDNGLGMFACRILDGMDVIASANVSVFEPPDATAFLESPSA